MINCPLIIVAFIHLSFVVFMIVQTNYGRRFRSLLARHSVNIMTGASMINCPLIIVAFIDRSFVVFMIIKLIMPGASVIYIIGATFTVCSLMMMMISSSNSVSPPHITLFAAIIIIKFPISTPTHTVRRHHHHHHHQIPYLHPTSHCSPKFGTTDFSQFFFKIPIF